MRIEGGHGVDGLERVDRLCPGRGANAATHPVGRGCEDGTIAERRRERCDRVGHLGREGVSIRGAHPQRQRGAQAFGIDGLEQQVDEVAAGESGDADREMHGGAAKGYRGVNPPTRQVQHVAGAQRLVEGRGAGRLTLNFFAHSRPGFVRQRVNQGRLVYPPPLVTGDLDDEHVVHVVVRVEATGLRGCDVGVDLAGMADVGDQLPSEVSEGCPGAVQPLQHDRRARREFREHLGRVDLIAHLRAEPAGTREPDRGQNLALSGHPDEGGPDAAARDQLVDSVGAEQVVIPLRPTGERALLPRVICADMPIRSSQ